MQNRTRTNFDMLTPTTQSGISLIELLITLAIGLVITAALGTLFLNIMRSNDELAKINTQIENGRFAIQVLQDDVMHAGFWGEYIPQFDNFSSDAVPSDAPSSIPDICTAFDPAAWDDEFKNNLIGLPLQVYGGIAPTGSGCVADIDGSRQPNTDVLVVRHANTCVADNLGCDSYVAGELYFQPSLSFYAENADENCPFGSTADTEPYLLDVADFDTLTQKDCSTPNTEKRKFISNIYYVRNYANQEDDGIPTLMRSSFGLSGAGLIHQDGIPLIEGIEAFRIELGVDSLSDSGAPINYAEAITWADEENLTSPTNRGDGAVDGAFVSCTTAIPCTVDQLTNVVAVKIHVLARATRSTPGYIDDKSYTLGSQTIGPFNDEFKRHVFSTTVRLPNISGRRETP